MFSKISRALVLSPHTDDGELGAGGLISKLINHNIHVDYIAFSAAEESVPAGFPTDILRSEVFEATKKLGINSASVVVKKYPVRLLNFHRQEILDDLITYRKHCLPDLILIPSLNDVHQDHATVANEALRAFKSTTILSYELPWNNIDFNASFYVKLSEEEVNRKCSALSEYKSQSGRQYISNDFTLSLARVRGCQINVEFAECFEVVRWIV
jgi:N-acetylglucosamine malate deacetylase 1